MKPPAPSTARVWIAVPLLAAGFLLWAQSAHRARILHVTHAVPSDTVVRSASPTGYAGGIRQLYLPEQNHDSAHWIAQTQQMFARGEARVRHIDYENAPFGRAVISPSPYRWWLGLVAWTDGLLSGRPVGQSVEQAALHADPLWHLLLLALATGFTAWRFGARPAALLSLGLVLLFPLAAAFPPGLPSDQTLAHAATLAGGLTLLAGVRANRHAGRWFFAAGVIGGLGLWLSVAETMPMVLGCAAGAVLAAWLGRRDPDALSAASPLPRHWLLWSLGGGASSLVFYLVEFAPAHLGSWQLRTIHPLYSLAWIGLGPGLLLATQSLRGQPPAWNLRSAGALLLAVATIAPLPILMVRDSTMAFLTADAWSYRLTRLPGSPEATSLGTWMARDGLSPALAATLLPMVMVLIAGWLLWRRDTDAVSRAGLAVAVGPVVVGLGLACGQLGRWSGVDTQLVTLLVAITVAVGATARSALTPVRWTGVVVLLLIPGLFQLWPPIKDPKTIPLNEVEVSSLIARDLAHWLAKHAPPDGAVVLAPPGETAALHYYGGLPGIATLAWENQPGIAAAVRLFSATSLQEAQALVRNRAVTHIVIPSWDRYLDEYIRLGGAPAEQTFLTGLRTWAHPGWLKPVAYQLPAVPGYEDQAVTIFEVVEEQDEAAALSRLAEYFAEMGHLDFAAQVGQALQKYPADLGAGIARAHVAMVRRDTPGLTAALADVVPQLTAGADRWLPWDRRVSLTVVLTQGGRADLARQQVQRCLAEADTTRLRSLSTGALYRLLLLAKRFDLDFPDAPLRATALDLLPPAARERL